MRTMTDPYRTPGIVETDEQRVERLYKIYCYTAGSGTPSDPVKRAEAMAQLETARRDWMRAAARLSYATATKPSTTGAGNGTP